MLMDCFIRALADALDERGLGEGTFTPERCDALRRSGLGEFDCVGLAPGVDPIRPCSPNEGLDGFSGESERPKLPSSSEAISMC